MPSDYIPGLSKKRTWRNSDPMERILKDWYGRKTGSNEIISRLPEAESIKDGVNKALKKLVNKETAFLRQMKDEWPNIAGAQLAKVTAPSSFYKGTLFVEVSHPAWLMQLGKNENEMLMNNIHEFAKNKNCRSIKFVPQGRNR